MRYAVFDLGSNSIKFLVAETREARVHVVYEKSITTRLAEHLIDTCELRPEAIARTLTALRNLRGQAASLGVENFSAVATSAVRDARNSEAFKAWVKSATGWTLEVISGLEEGRLIHLGIVTHEPGAQGRCLLIDLGGGSCEVTVSDHGRIQQMVSLPLGAVRLQSEFLRNDPPTKEDMARLRKFIDR